MSLSPERREEIVREAVATGKILTDAGHNPKVWAILAARTALTLVLGEEEVDSGEGNE